ncbi:MAG TPA: PKD domain-containing protein, partial [Bacteroidetes bacterium]|nr:PKD domain-containing protein [Bacteroidota bacterium]
MSNRLYQILFILLLCLSNSDLHASHARAMDIYYECLGNNYYKFYVKFYRDCIGVNEPNNIVLNIRSSSCNKNININLADKSGPIEISQLCPAQLGNSQCVSSSKPYPGTEEYIYTTNPIQLQQCSDWIMRYDLCCRNSAITNIVSPSSKQIYIEASLDNTNNICNNSPQYSNYPILYGCINQPLCFNHGATDPDVDSLSFELITPMGVNGSLLTFSSGLSVNNPIFSSTPITFDQNTGQLCLTPNQVQQGVVAIKTYEWKLINGIYVNTSYSNREVQLIIIGTCGAIYAGDPSYTFNVNSGTISPDSITLGVCEGQTIDFEMIVTDPNPSTNYTITTNANVATPGATVTMTGNNPVSLHYNWTTNATSVGQYLISLSVDNTDCPIPRVIYKTLVIQVHDGIVTNIADTSVCDNSIIIDAGVTGNADYQWSTGILDSVININTDGTYWVDITRGQCTVRDSVLIGFFDSTSANFNMNPNCQNEISDFFDLSQSTSNQWQWNFGDGGVSTIQNPGHTYTSPGTYQVDLITSNSSVCYDTISKSITIDAPLIVDIGPDTNQCGGAILLDGSVGSNVSYTWSDGTPDSILNVSSSGTFWLQIDHNGCTERDSAIINIFSLPNSGFSWTGNCTDSFIVFSDLSSSGTNTWIWNFGDNTFTETIQNPEHDFENGTGIFEVSLVVTDAIGCTDTTYKHIWITDEYWMYVPNSFTPDNDQINDVFCISYHGIRTETFQFIVYN